MRPRLQTEQLSRVVRGWLPGRFQAGSRQAGPIRFVSIQVPFRLASMHVEACGLRNTACMYAYVRLAATYVAVAFGAARLGRHTQSRAAHIRAVHTQRAGTPPTPGIEHIYADTVIPYIIIYGICSAYRRAYAAYVSTAACYYMLSSNTILIRGAVPLAQAAHCDTPAMHTHLHAPRGFGPALKPAAAVALEPRALRCPTLGAPDQVARSRAR